jgi:hypothetical protein
VDAEDTEEEEDIKELEVDMDTKPFVHPMYLVLHSHSTRGFDYQEMSMFLARFVRSFRPALPSSERVTVPGRTTPLLVPTEK